MAWRLKSRRRAGNGTQRYSSDDVVGKDARRGDKAGGTIPENEEVGPQPVSGTLFRTPVGKAGKSVFGVWTVHEQVPVAVWAVRICPLSDFMAAIPPVMITVAGPVISTPCWFLRARAEWLFVFVPACGRAGRHHLSTTMLLLAVCPPAVFQKPLTRLRYAVGSAAVDERPRRQASNNPSHLR